MAWIWHIWLIKTIKGRTGSSPRKQSEIMKWMESIKVRAAVRLEKKAAAEFISLVKDIESPGLDGVRVYLNVAYKGDISVQLHWDSEEPEHQGSFLGLKLEQAMKEFGLVDHSVWVEFGPSQGRSSFSDGEFWRSET